MAYRRARVKHPQAQRRSRPFASRLKLVSLLATALVLVLATLARYNTAGAGQPVTALAPGYEWLAEAGLGSLHILFSTTCHDIHDFQPWQTEVLVYTHKKHRYPGRITELRGCNDDKLWVPPRHTYPPHQVVRVKDYDLLRPNDSYAPRKRPHSLAYLVQHMPDHIRDDELVVVLDPDQALLAPWPDLGVRQGRPAAAGISVGHDFIRFAPQLCHGRGNCSEQGLRDSGRWSGELEVGAPYVLHPHDFRQLAPVWAEVLETARQNATILDAWGWYSDQLTFILASLQLGLFHKRAPLLVNHWADESEGWHLITPQLPGGVQPPLVVLHYCQEMQISGETYLRHPERPNYNARLHDCKLKAAEYEMPAATTLVNGTILEQQLRARQSLSWKSGESREQLYGLRHFWMYRTLMPLVNEAFEHYRWEVCGSAAASYERYITE